MATKFENIFSRAIFRFADHDFLKEDIEAREEILEQYLMSAVAEFHRLCRTDIGEYNLTTKEFSQTLDDEVIEILALGIAFYWLSYKSLNSELLKNVLNSRDYYYYSPANLLKEIQTLRKTLRDEFNSRLRFYSYNNNTLSSLKA